MRSRVSCALSGIWRRWQRISGSCITDVQERTAGREGITVNIALNYGGRHEIVHAVQQAARPGPGRELLPLKRWMRHWWTA